MSDLTTKLDADLKSAMLGGDKKLTSVLRGLKSALQYARVETGAELSEAEIIKVLQRESKKRAEAVKIYREAKEAERTRNEEYEKEIIDSYLPELLSEEQVVKLVDSAIDDQGELTRQNMGKIIAEVRQRSDGRADGSLIARLVKERLDQ